MKKTYKAQGQSGLFSEEKRLNKLSKQGDPLERLDQVIDWSIFLNLLNKIHPPKKHKAGAKPYNPLLLFKMVILQRYYGLSDDQLEYQAIDRLSFSRFLGMTLEDLVPDAKTVWLFREKMKELNLEKELFDALQKRLEEAEMIAKEGKIVDASFVKVPIQRNTKKENKHIKKTGKAPKDWEENPSKLSQKDVDARWTKTDNVGK